MISLQQQVNSVKNAKKNLSAVPSGNTCSRKVHQYTVTTHTSISRNAQQLKLRGQTGDIGLSLLISASRPKFSPWPQPLEYGLGFRCSASDSSIWPRLTLLVHCEKSTQGATTYCYSTRHNWQAGIPVRVYMQEKQKIPQKHVTFQRGQKLQCNIVTTQSSVQLKFFFSHISHSAPNEDHHHAVADTIFKSLYDWKWLPERPYYMWLRATESRPRLLSIGLSYASNFLASSRENWYSTVDMAALKYTLVC